MKKRPIGIILLSILYLLAGLVSCLVLRFMGDKLVPVFELLGMSHETGIMFISVIAGLSFITGVFLWTGNKLGWLLGIAMIIYSIVRSVSAIGLIPDILIQADLPSSAATKYYIRYGFRIIAHLIILCYFFKRSVVEYFDIQSVQYIWNKLLAPKTPPKQEIPEDSESDSEYDLESDSDFEKIENDEQSIDSEDENSKENSKFQLSIINKIFFGIVALAHIMVLVLFLDKTPYLIGSTTGRIFASILLPFIAGWSTWKLSKGNLKFGNIAFNVSLLLILLGQAGNYVQDFQSFSIRSLEQYKEAFKRDLSSTDDPLEIDSINNEYMDTVTDTFDELAKQGSPHERKFYSIMKSFVEDTKEVSTRWNNAFNEVLNPRILDYSYLEDENEFNYQREVLQTYIEESTLYEEYFLKTLPNLESRLSVLGEGNDLVRGALRGAENKHKAQRPIFATLIDAHMNYGNTMIQILDLLESDLNSWYYESELFFEDEDMLAEYNILIDQLGSSEDTINEYSDKMITLL